VRFIIKRDPKGLFAFAPMQSDIAQQLMERHADADLGSDTILLIKNGVCYVVLQHNVVAIDVGCC